MKRKAADGTEDILSAAVFTSKTPASPEAGDGFKSLKPLTLIQTLKDGETVSVCVS